MTLNRFALQSALISVVLLANVFAEPLTINISDEVLLKDVRRFGINLGEHQSYGGAQLLKNIVPNPGFEAGIYGTVVLVGEGATESAFPQALWDAQYTNDKSGVGQPAGFWDAAQYEVLYGSSAGRSGRIERFEIDSGRNVFHLDNAGPPLHQGDVVIVSTAVPGVHTGREVELDTAAVGETRPGSPGSQSMFIEGGRRQGFRMMMDNTGSHSGGNLYQVKGPWELRFWAKGSRPGVKLKVRFARLGRKDFLSTTFSLTDQWKEYSETFTVSEAADDPDAKQPNGRGYPLALQIEVSSPSGDAWIDDLSVSRSDHHNPTEFSDTVVDRLMELRPGVLRYWATQFGETLDNQLQPPFGRRAHGFTPKKRMATHFSYSLHEFLSLCELVGAEPWYVVPPTFTSEELTNLVAYLAAPATAETPYAKRRVELGRNKPWTEAFPQIHLEFGNELWGSGEPRDPFFGASVRGGKRLGEIAGNRFAIMRNSEWYSADRLNLIIGGQLAVPNQQFNIASSSSTHDAIALAPYFGRLEEFSSDEEVLRPLLAMPFDDVDGGRVAQSMNAIERASPDADLAIYEINYGLVRGGAPVDLRNRVIAGGVGAMVLPLHMLQYQSAFGARHQCAFTFAQYSFSPAQGEQLYIWGLLRDVEVTSRKRPTWLGLELVNRAIRGDLMTVELTGDVPTWSQSMINGLRSDREVPAVAAFAYADERFDSVILFNVELRAALNVRVKFASEPIAHPKRYSIAPNSLLETNEVIESIVIEESELNEFRNGDEVELPAHSVSVLVWDGSSQTDK